MSDRRRLSELNLPKENVLYLNTPPPEGNENGVAKLELGEEVGLGKPRTTYTLNFQNNIQRNPQLASHQRLNMNVFLNGAVDRITFN